MRKAKKSTLKKKADKLFSELIRKNGACEWCGKKASGQYLHCAHINSRRFLVTRWLPLNALALCPACHRKAHDQPIEFTEWIKEYLGTDVYAELRRIAKTSTKKIVIEEVIERLQRIIKEAICQL